MIWTRLTPFKTASEYEDWSASSEFVELNEAAQSNLRALMDQLPIDEKAEQWFASSFKRFLFAKFCKRWGLFPQREALKTLAGIIDSERRDWQADGLISDGGRLQFAITANKLRMSDVVVVTCVDPIKGKGRIFYDACVIRRVGIDQYLVLMDLAAG